MSERDLLAMAGYSGLSDSPEKFRMILSALQCLRDAVVEDRMDESAWNWFGIIYGKAPGLIAASIEIEFKCLQELPEEADAETREWAKQALIVRLEDELNNWKQLMEIYREEELGLTASRSDADLLPPADDLDKIIRYEAHLEDQIERKLKQFYGRRRESVCREEEVSMPALNQRPAELAQVAETISEGRI
jgi:hypothetical protein